MKRILYLVIGLVLCTGIVVTAAYLGRSSGLQNTSATSRQVSQPVTKKGSGTVPPTVRRSKPASPNETSEEENIRSLKLN